MANARLLSNSLLRLSANFSPKCKNEILKYLINLIVYWFLFEASFVYPQTRYISTSIAMNAVGNKNKTLFKV